MIKSSVFILLLISMYGCTAQPSFSVADINDKGKILNFLYGNYNKNSETGFILPKNREADTLMVQITFSESIVLDGMKKFIYIVQKSPVNCGNCTPYLDIIEFIYSEDRKIWELSFTDKNFGQMGNWGKAPSEMEIQKIGDNSYGLFVETGTTLQGITNIDLRVFSIINSHFQPILSIENYYMSNSGACNEELKNCYEYNSNYTLAKSSSDNYYHIIVESVGNKIEDQKLTNFNTRREYIFNDRGKKYILKSI